MLGLWAVSGTTWKTRNYAQEGRYAKRRAKQIDAEKARGGAATQRVSIPDGVNLLSSSQVCGRLGLSPKHLSDHKKAGRLVPCMLNGRIYYTGADVARFERDERERAIMLQLRDGRHPIDIALDGHFPLAEVSEVMQRWAQVAGVWIVDAPPGSYARWLERLGLVRLRPSDIRRLIELMLTDPEVMERARRHVARVVGEPAPQ